MADGDNDGVPHGGRGESCECCNSTENLKRCSRCRGVFYCSREHQLQDWKKHKRQCKKTVAEQGQGGSVDPSSTSASTKLDHSTTQIPKDSDSVNHGKEYRGSETSEIKTSIKIKGQQREALQNRPRAVSVNVSAKSSNSELGHKVENGVKSRPKSSLSFDPRPFVHTDFPKPKSRDRDTVVRHAASHLRNNGYCVLDGFLAEKNGRSVLDEVKSIQDSGVLIDGPLSGGRTSSEKSEKFTERAIRGDKITWLQGNEACYPSIGALISQMDDLIQRLTFYLQGMYTISGRTKAMVACYPGNGAGYACHVDNPNRDGRCVTCLYYLNDSWDVKTQGGLLRLLPASGGYVDVQPLLNRLLLFWSDRRNPHEVQPAFDMRYAITVWYFDKSEREEAKMAQMNEDMSRLCGEVSLPDVKTKKEEKDQVERELEEKSNKAVAGLSHGELQALSAMLEGQPDPRAALTNLGVAPSIQAALLCQLKEIKLSGHC